MKTTISYLDPALSYADRQRTLQQAYDFTCECSLCAFGRHIERSISLQASEEEVSVEQIKEPLCDYTGCMLTRPPPHIKALRNYDDIPGGLHRVFHKSTIPQLSESFSKASHEGSFAEALDVGHTLLAVYLLIYPPNYPQIGEYLSTMPSRNLNRCSFPFSTRCRPTGMHALELAKTAWNAVVVADVDSRSISAVNLLTDARWYLSVASDILDIFGQEGDEGGPLAEIGTLRGLIYEESSIS